MNHHAFTVSASHLRTPAALLFLLAAASANAAIYTVGSPVGPGQCTHGTIQSAINAAQSSPGADTIRLTRSLTYEPEANTVATSQDLNIVGGFATCTQSASDGIYTIVSGGLANGGAVFRITANGSAVIKLRHLQITRGEGRGIAFDGNGILQTIESTIDNNDGGGISAEATGTDAELVIDAGTVIANNRAGESAGGGVALSGPIEMTMIAPQTIIAFNDTLTRGGGLLIGRFAHAYIGSPGYSGLPAIYGNSARYDGGGIAAWGVLKLFTTDPSRPVRVEDNFGGGMGGGISVYSFFIGTGRLCAWDFVIDNNAAEAGSGISADGPGTVVLNRNEYPGCERHPASVPCAPGVACNSIAGNISQDADGNPTPGAAIETTWTDLVGRRFQMRNNVATNAIRATRGGFSIDECLIADNVVSHNLLNADVDDTEFTSYLYVNNCTLARNVIGGDSVMYASDDLSLFNSIVDQPGIPAQTFGGDPANRRLGYLLLTNAQAMPADPTIRQGDPRFVAPESGDYHLRSSSPAIDFAPAIVSGAFDLDGHPRDVDLPGVPNEYGPRDLGAFERQPSLVQNGDFDFSDLRHWTWYAGEWDGSQNAAGSAGSGSWKFSATGLTQPRVAVGQQCVRLPEPGRYLLNGWGHGGGNTIATRDYAILAWEFRRDGTEACNVGSADASGQIVVGSGTSWGHPAQPAIIDVSDLQWGPNSSITITLTAEDGGITSPRSISAWFDGITLDIDGNVIFADDFEP